MKKSELLSLTLCFFSFVSLSAQAAIPRENRIQARPSVGNQLVFFELEKGHHSIERLRIESRVISHDRALVLTYFASGGVSARTPIPESTRARLLTEFEKVLPRRKRLRLRSGGPCGQKLVVRYRAIGAKKVSAERLCLDAMPGSQQVALSKWWRDTRQLVGL